MIGKDTHLTFILVILVVLGSLASMYYLQAEGINTSKIPFINSVKKQVSPIYPQILVIKSSAFENESRIPEKYTCKGENISPPLEFLNLPSEAQSLILIVSDPEAPLKDFIHWVVFNIDPTTTNVSENSIPRNGLLGQNSLGKGDYTGPCPSLGTHKYIFTLFALNTEMDKTKTYTKDSFMSIYKENIIDVATLTGMFGE